MKTRFVEFGGERYEVPAGKNPRSIADAQRMQRALRAAEKPAEAPQASSGGGGSRKSQTAPTASPRPSPRASSNQPRNSQGVSGDPRTSDGYNRIGASNPGTQRNTARVPVGPGTLSSPSTPTGSGMTRTAGSQADRSPSRSQPRRMETPSGPESNVSTKQSRYKPMVRKEDIKTFAQWMDLSPEQRRNAGLPSSQIGARRYFAGLK